MRGIVLIAALLLVACAPEPAPDAAMQLLQGEPAAGFERATEPRSFEFPRDHGPHPAFQTEWWYVTGTLDADDRAFGFQVTFFRFGLQPGSSPAGWASHHLWLAQLAVSDLDGERFLDAERVSREALGLAGARSDGLDVRVEDWRLVDQSDGLDRLRLVAAEPEFGIDLTLDAVKPMVLQGEAGLSRKSATPGNASYYYSFPRLAATGTVRIDDQRWPVTGLAWMDREWSTSALDADQQGWDWFALHLDDGYDLMLYRLRRPDGTMHDYSAGKLVAPDGSTRALAASQFTLEPAQWWRSPETGRRYPLTWRLEAPDLSLRVQARMADQEHHRRFDYWEGAVNGEGRRAGRPVQATGYLEMTGYP